jgi:hypothetical protein
MPQKAQFQVFLQTLAEMLAADREQKSANRQPQGKARMHRFLTRSGGGTGLPGTVPNARARLQEGQDHR